MENLEVKLAERFEELASVSGNKTERREEQPSTSASEANASFTTKQPNINDGTAYQPSQKLQCKEFPQYFRETLRATL